jgi:hypothetical protein
MAVRVVLAGRRRVPIFHCEFDRRVFALDSRTAATETHDQSHKKNHQEDVKQNFRNSSGRGRHAGESEERSYQRNDQKHYCPIKHRLPPNLKTVSWDILHPKLRIATLQDRAIGSSL